MTVKEALIAELDESTFSGFTIEKVLLDNGVAGSVEYVSITHEELVDMAVIDCLKIIIGRYQSVSEGGYSVSKSIEGLKFRINGYYIKWGLLNPEFGAVQDASYLW